MTLAEKVEQYAKQHPQQVTLAWVDRTTCTYSADRAVQLCTNRQTAGRIIGALTKDKALERMLNRLVDGE